MKNSKLIYTIEADTDFKKDMHDIAYDKYSIEGRQKFLGSKNGRVYTMVPCIHDSISTAFIIEYQKER